MSEPAAKQRPIDLDEFERRLRAPAPAVSSQEDPLAELARLVGGTDHFRAPSVGLPKATYQPLVGSPRDWSAQEPVAEAFDPGSLRGALPEPSQEYADDPAAYEEEEYYAPSGGEGQAPRSRRAPLIMGGALVLVLAGIAVTFAMKQREPVAGEAPTIKAAAGPTKVQPAAQDNVNVADRNASLLDRSNADRVTSSHVVDHAEQPVDLKAVPLQQSAAASAPSGAPAQPAPAAARPASAASFFPDPVRVRTVSVRPDGTIIADDPPSPPVRSVVPVSAPPTSITNVAFGVAPATPNVAAAAPPAAPKPATATTPKTVARVATTPKDTAGLPVSANGAQAANASPANPPTTARPAAPPAKPIHVAAVDPADGAKIAPLAAAGTYSVQLAAPGSEQEAKDTTARLEKKFTAELRGHHTAIVKADSNGRTVYRVRVVGLTSDDANVLCSKLKAGGGACFVARD